MDIGNYKQPDYLKNKKVIMHIRCDILVNIDKIKECESKAPKMFCYQNTKGEIMAIFESSLCNFKNYVGKYSMRLLWLILPLMLLPLLLFVIAIIFYESDLSGIAYEITTYILWFIIIGIIASVIIQTILSYRKCVPTWRKNMQKYPFNTIPNSLPYSSLK